MKLAYIVNANLPPDDWAHTIQIMNMCKAFAEIGVDVTLYVPKRNMPVLDPFEFYGMKKTFCIEKVSCIDIFVRRPNPIWYWLRLISFYISARTKLLFSRFDIMYSRDLYASFFFPGIFLERHSAVNPKGFLQRTALRMSGGIIVLTSFIKDRFVSAGISQHKIMVSADAVDIDMFQSSRTVIIKEISSGDFVTGYIGTLKTMGKDKGVLDALRAHTLLPENFKFLVVGGEPTDIEFYKKISEEMNIASRVIFVGRVSHQEISTYAKSCHALVAPFPDIEHYRYFMSPLKIFEYMASGVPIVTTKLPSITEVLADGRDALLVPLNNPQALSDALVRLQKDPELAKRLAATAKKEVEEKYTWKKRAENILGFFKMRI